MRIPSDTPSSVHNVRSGALQALGLRPGQTFTAQVLSHTPDGLTNLQVNNQQLSLALPSKAQIGVFLKFEFQGGGAKPQITFLGEQTKTNQTPPTQNQTPTPHSSTVRVPTPNPQPAFTTNISQQPPPAKTISNSTPPQSPSSTSTQTPSSPQTNISVPLPPATKAALKLYPSQFINAKVISTNPNGQTTLQIAQQQITTTLPNDPQIGTSLKFQVQITGNQTNLVLNSTTPSNNQNLTTNPLKSPTIPNPQTNTQPQATTPTNITQNTTIIQNPIAQAISQAIPTNIAKQDSMSALFTNLAGLQNQSDKVSPAIIKTAQQLENTKLNFDAKIPTGENLQKAIKQSGIFLESILAQPQIASNQQNISTIKTATQSDLKLLLLLFRSTITKWIGEQTSPQKPNDNRPNPPIKGAPPRSTAPTQSAISQNQPSQNLAQTLLNNTDSALSRLRLFQLTSLPESSARAQNLNSQELNLELPFTYNGETNILRFQINRDGSLKSDEGENSWQMRFSMNLDKIGEVGADVAFRYKKVNATIWASEKETADILTNLLPELKETLLEKELDLGSIHVRYGAPKPQENPYPTKGNIK